MRDWVGWSLVALAFGLGLACNSSGAGPKAPGAAPDQGPGAPPPPAVAGGDGMDGPAPVGSPVAVQPDAGTPPTPVPVPGPAAGGPDASAPASATDAGPEPAPASDFEPVMHWREGTPMPTARTELAVARLGERIYVAGGYGGQTAFESYAPESDTWDIHASLPVTTEHPSLAALAGLLYLTGAGQTGLFAYDPASDAWTTRASPPDARHAAAAVALDGGLYLLGGTGADPLKVMHYDPATDMWSLRGELDMVRDHLTVVVQGGLLYVLGGRPGVGEAYTSVVVYDPSDQSLSSAPSLLEGRSGFGAAAVGPWICVAGGEVLVQPFFARDTAECLDPQSGSWHFVDPLPVPLHGVGAVGYDGRMYLFGGAQRAASATPRAGGVYILEP